MKTYRVKNWQEIFENNRSREIKNTDWVPISNRHDGFSYCTLLNHPNGMAHYGAWMLIVQVASKCEPRGTLVRDGGIPHDHRSLALVTRSSLKIFEQALPRLVEVGWLEEVSSSSLGGSTHNPDGSLVDAAPCRTEVPRTEGKGREGKGKELRERAREVLDHLNFVAERRFSGSDAQLAVIIRRLQEPEVTIEGVKKTIDRLVARWKGDPKMQEFLRPDTIFSGKFQSYYDDRDIPVATVGKPARKIENPNYPDLDCPTIQVTVP